MNNAQIAVLGGSGVLAVVSQGQNTISLLRDLGGQSYSPTTLRTQGTGIAAALGFVLIATWFAGINNDTAVIAIMVVIAVWLVHFYNMAKK